MSDQTQKPMDSMMEIFLMETNEFLSKIEEILINAEKDGDSIRKATPEIFRIMHTIKSSSAMMSLSNISRLSHKVEDLFYFLREHPDVQVDDSRLIDIVLDVIDFIKRNLDGTQGEDPSDKIEYIGKYLEEIKGGRGAQSQPAQADGQTKAPPAPNNNIITVNFKADTQMLGLRSLEVVNRVAAAAASVTSIPEDPTMSEDLIRENGLILLIKSDKTISELKSIIGKSPFVGLIEVAGQKPPEASADPGVPPHQFVERRRDSPTFGKAYASVEISKLDTLVDLVGEALIAQMELAQSIEERNFVACDTDAAKLKKLILNLQEAALSTRMLPIKDVFLKMNRLVRDMTRKLGREVEFVTSGEDTEVDRSIIENISSPLMHILRNAIDHGIEPEAVRLANGKPAKGLVTLSAATEGRNVVVTVTDDGMGFDAEKIVQKAVASGIVTAADAARLSEEDIYAMVFLPGFSTNQEVTEYSGRGVGMDVVNESMKKMNGKVIVQSEAGKGSSVILKIPLTLAIIDTLLLRVDTEICAIPVSFVEKIIFMNEENSIRQVNGDDVVLFDGECYKILNLFDFYSFTRHIPYEDGTLLIVGDGRRKYAAFASEILDRQEVVVKPAPPIFKTIRGISGCTILGNGRICLILDTDELLTTQNIKRSRA